jgi:hypothetical protein
MPFDVRFRLVDEQLQLDVDCAFTEAEELNTLVE